MEFEEFEWDAAKRLSNLGKHGIDFLRARAVFDGRPRRTERSTYTQEERFLTTGILADRFVTVSRHSEGKDSHRRSREGS